MATKKKLLQAAAGNAGGDALNVEDVFSTYLYEGNGSTQTITNGIDLDGEGGLVWIKSRAHTYPHALFDTERGATKQLKSNSSAAERTLSTLLTSFNNNGFSLGSDSDVNGTYSTAEYASWSFRKAPKFFDVVTYTGDGTNNRQIAHDLDATVGMVVVKRLDSTGDFFTWHRTFSDNQNVALNDNFAVSTLQNYLVTASSTTFTVGSNTDVNRNGSTYVAYLFAHNDGDGEFGPDGDADIIKCGSYTGTGSTNGPEIDLGFEPQWVMVKRADAGSEHWAIIDNMREMISLESGNARMLKPNNSEAEEGVGFANPLATGFKVNRDEGVTNASGGTYIYIAIRRGTAVPESATEVFAVTTQSGSTPPAHDTGFVTDFSLRRENALSSASVIQVADRLRGKPYLTTEGTNSETNLNNNTWDFMDGWFGATSNDSNKYAWSWKRAPKYFDVVAYTGDGTNGRAISHNLGVAPEMMWVKVRNAANDWVVYHKDLGEDTILRLNSTSATISKNVFSSNTPTDSVFYVQASAGYDVNYSSKTYIAYLFASLDGISKVGSVSHTTGSNTDVDCGFSAGARFVILKGADIATGWLVFDSTRGIISGNSPTLNLSSTSAEDSSQDRLDPYSSGFSVGPDIGTGTWIYYAIA